MSHRQRLAAHHGGMPWGFRLLPATHPCSTGSPYSGSLAFGTAGLAVSSSLARQGRHAVRVKSPNRAPNLAAAEFAISQRGTSGNC